LNRRLLTIVLAALLAVIGTVAVLEYVHKANVRAIAGLQTENVYYATGTISAGTKLGDALRNGLVATEQLPVKNVISGELTPATIARLTGQAFDATVQQGQNVMENMLVNPSSVTSAGAPSAAPRGDQEVSIQFCASEAAYVTAGSQVAVYATFPDSLKVTVSRTCDVSHSAVPNGTATTFEVLPKVLVMSVTQAQTGAQSTSSGSSSVVADPISSGLSSALSSGAVLVTFAVPASDVTQLITDCQVAEPYLALLPTNS
jgi:pilus assembly protein CpaB